MSDLSLLHTCPNFTLTDDQNKPFQLSNHLGSKVLLYFYPKDDTPGCTLEAKDFRDLMPEFLALNTLIVGISKDSTVSHLKFKEKYCLPFTLLSDIDGKVCELYDTWKQKSMYGKVYMGIERTTFLIDETGKLIHTWRKVSASGHAQEVLNKVMEYK